MWMERRHPHKALNDGGNNRSERIRRDNPMDQIPHVYQPLFKQDASIMLWIVLRCAKCFRNPLYFQHIFFLLVWYAFYIQRIAWKQTATSNYRVAVNSSQAVNFNIYWQRCSSGKNTTSLMILNRCWFEHLQPAERNMFSFNLVQIDRIDVSMSSDCNEHFLYSCLFVARIGTFYPLNGCFFRNCSMLMNWELYRTTIVSNISLFKHLLRPFSSSNSDFLENFELSKLAQLSLASFILDFTSKCWVNPKLARSTIIFTCTKDPHKLIELNWFKLNFEFSLGVPHFCVVFQSFRLGVEEA